MAGDWIKVEVATLDKPEVMRMAELLGVKRDEMVGILFRFWVWLDRSTGNGVVTHASRFGIDEVMHVCGFGAALESVGWCLFDEAALTLTVPGFEKHNGNPAKTRALGRDRKREFDERKSNANTVTREEKRIEEKSKGGKASTARARATPQKTPLPDGFAISPRVQEWAVKAGHRNLDERLTHFIGKALANGYRYVDWDEAFMGAVRDDWAKLAGRPANGTSRLTPIGQQSAQNLERWIENEGDRNGTDGP